ncbi:hypothetical protein BDQ17DRAFT_917614 [Cyathus striatus]|nr:hypothetical protein BDQ17DRAFT_917614 [Cyathus striatus]
MALPNVHLHLPRLKPLHPPKPHRPNTHRTHAPHSNFSSTIVWSATNLENAQHTLLVSVQGAYSSAVFDAVIYTTLSHPDVRFIAIGSSIGGFILLSFLICLCAFLRRYKCVRRTIVKDILGAHSVATASPAKIETPSISRAASLHKHDPVSSPPAAAEGSIIPGPPIARRHNHTRRTSQPEELLLRSAEATSVVPSFPLQLVKAYVSLPPLGHFVIQPRPPLQLYTLVYAKSPIYDTILPIPPLTPTSTRI